MIDKDFAKIKAYFPALRWRRFRLAATGPCVGFEGGYGGWRVYIVLRAFGWQWQLADDAGIGTTRVRAGIETPHLGRCLRSLECAIRREAKTLAGMVGLTTCL